MLRVRLYFLLTYITGVEAPDIRQKMIHGEERDVRKQFLGKTGHGGPDNTI